MYICCIFFKQIHFSNPVCILVIICDSWFMMKPIFHDWWYDCYYFWFGNIFTFYLIFLLYLILFVYLFIHFMQMNAYALNCVQYNRKCMSCVIIRCRRVTPQRKCVSLHTEKYSQRRSKITLTFCIPINTARGSSLCEWHIFAQVGIYICVYIYIYELM